MLNCSLTCNHILIFTELERSKRICFMFSIVKNLSNQLIRFSLIWLIPNIVISWYLNQFDFLIFKFLLIKSRLINLFRIFCKILQSNVISNFMILIHSVRYTLVRFTYNLDLLRNHHKSHIQTKTNISKSLHKPLSK